MKLKKPQTSVTGCPMKLKPPGDDFECSRSLHEQAKTISERNHRLVVNRAEKLLTIMTSVALVVDVLRVNDFDRID